MYRTTIFKLALLFVVIPFAVCNTLKAQDNLLNESNITKMKIEIWSDVACPFCYIGQEHLNKALSSFPERQNIEIEWKSFILDPTLPENTEKNLYEMLSEQKGMPLTQVMEMTRQVKNMAANAGLELNFDDAKPVNTRKAHRLIQLAKSENLGAEMEARLFEAYFTEGANVADTETLISLGTQAGLDKEKIRQALISAEFDAMIDQDLLEARQLGVRGVPFFLIDEKYALSGAQPVSVFVESIGKAYAEWKVSQPSGSLELKEGPVCKPSGECD
jgi:protein disulfide-isomerase